MNRRQKLVQQQYLNDEEKIIKRLNLIYNQSLVQVNDKIKNLQFSIDNLQLEYDWMDDTDPKKAQVKSMIQSKIYQKQYQEQLQKQLDGILDKMQTQQYLNVSDYLDGCYEDGFVGTMFDMHGQGVPLMIPLDQEAMVRAVQLESKISKGLYTKLGEDVDQLKTQIRAQVSRSIATGMSYAQTAKQLANYSRIGYNKSIRIARTEGHRIQTTAAMDACHKAKERGADVLKQWDATLDDATRESHRQVDGEIRELDESFSNGLDFPGDPAGGAGEVVNCRCALLQRARWALDESELHTLEERAAYYGLDKTETFDDFKKKYLKVVSEPSIPVPSATAADPVTLDMFPEIFRKNSASKKATKTFVDALNEAENLNPNIRKLYTHMDDLPGLPDDCSISYTIKDHALEKWMNRYTGEITKVRLKLPKMQGDDLMGQKSTAFHEMGHFIDMGFGKGGTLKSTTYQKLTGAIQSSGRSMAPEIKDLFDDFAVQYKQLINDLQATYSAKRSALGDDYVNRKITYADYKKQFNALVREQEAERDYQARNLCGGGVPMLSDIYDALSGGEYQSSGTLLYGHGMKYYGYAGKAESEIFANYVSLSVNQPDLLKMLRKDKPDLCDALDQLIEEMAGGIK